MTVAWMRSNKYRSRSSKMNHERIPGTAVIQMITVINVVCSTRCATHFVWKDMALRKYIQDRVRVRWG